MWKFLGKLGLVSICPVCKTHPPEMHARGRVQKFDNGCCSSECYKNSNEYKQSRIRYNHGRLYRGAVSVYRKKVAAELDPNYVKPF